MLHKFWLNVRMFVEGARLSYIALFHWLRPTTYVASKVIMPVNQILFFTLLGVYATSRSNADFYIIGNSVQMASISGIYAMTMTIGGDRWAGTLPYLFGIPTNRLLMYLGRSLFNVFDGMIGVFMGLLFGVIFLGLDLSATDPLALTIVILVTTASTCGMGMALGSLSLITVNVFFINNVVYFLLIAFSGSNLPLEDLPGWMQAVSDFLPLTRGIAAARDVINGAHLGDITGLLAGELLVGVIYTAIGFFMFRWIEYHARRGGSLERI
ncbi:MAG: ABC transporter permease [Anaerolineae bacterium]|nr:ABC transporter permease [Anaerolineae bacterium]